MTEKVVQIVIDDLNNNLNNVITVSNQARDMIVRSLKLGDKSKKYSVDDVIKFLEDSSFSIEMEKEDQYNLVLKIPEKEKK